MLATGDNMYKIYAVLLLALFGMSACVSRYDPVEKIDPMSDDCKDFAGFSRALAIQRDNGFTKRANMSIAAQSVATEPQRKILYQRYRIMLDLAYADRMVAPDAIKLMGRIVCEQRRSGQWHEPQEKDLPKIANIIQTCGRQNITEPEKERCIVSELEQFWDTDLARPPVF